MIPQDLVPLDRIGLEQEADHTRARLIAEIEALEVRVQPLRNLRARLARGRIWLYAVGGFFAMWLGARIGDWMWRRANAAQLRLLALERAWKHPERLAR